MPSKKTGKETVRLINTHLSPYNIVKVVLIIDHTLITQILLHWALEQLHLEFQVRTPKN